MNQLEWWYHAEDGWHRFADGTPPVEPSDESYGALSYGEGVYGGSD